MALFFIRKNCSKVSKLYIIQVKMCLIVFSYKEHARYNLILVANRDEAFGRPTRAAQFWDDQPNLLAGKDLSAGGTWLGINKEGRVAALTNYRDPLISKENPPSRGHIITNYLAQQKEPEEFLLTLHKNSDRYMGFNLLAGTYKDLFHYSNQEGKINRIKPGIHGLSNHLLDTPWPKVERAKSGLASIAKQDSLTTDRLFNLMQDAQPASEENLPDTGIAPELEKSLSPIFIKTDEYGTRSTAVLLVDKKGKVTFEERRYKPRTMIAEETSRFEFEIDTPT